MEFADRGMLFDLLVRPSFTSPFQRFLIVFLLYLLIWHYVAQAQGRRGSLLGEAHPHGAPLRPCPFVSSLQQRPPSVLSLLLPLSLFPHPQPLLYFLSQDLNFFCSDIKSLNILVTKDWVAKLSDFGAAKLIPKGANTGYKHTQGRGTRTSSTTTVLCIYMYIDAMLV